MHMLVGHVDLASFGSLNGFQRAIDKDVGQLENEKRQ